MKEITQQEINNVIDFLEILKFKIENNNSFSIFNLAKEHKIKNSSAVVTSLRKLSYISSSARGHNKKFLLREIEPIHARNFIKECRLCVIKWSKNYKNNKKSKNSTQSTKSVEKESLGFTIEKISSMLLEKSVIILAGYRISGTFTIEEL